MCIRDSLEDLQRMQAHLRDEIKFYIAYKDDIAQGCAVIVSVSYTHLFTPYQKLFYCYSSAKRNLLPYHSHIYISAYAGRLWYIGHIYFLSLIHI